MEERTVCKNSDHEVLDILAKVAKYSNAFHFYPSPLILLLFAFYREKMKLGDLPLLSGRIRLQALCQC